MGAVRTKALADLRRRRLQGVALATVMLLASGAATLALNILVASHDPFDRAFDAANGAHLAIAYGTASTDAQLQATASAAGVTAAVGPYPVTPAGFGHPLGGLVVAQTVSGRPQPTATIDNLTIIAGRWWTSPGEAVLNRATAELLGKHVGDSLAVYPPPAGADKSGGGDVRAAPGGGGVGKTAAPQPPQPVLTVRIVGIAQSVSTPDVAAWMTPTDIGTIAGDRPLDREMLYRVSPAATEADLVAAAARITGGLPAGSVEGRNTYLETRASVNSTADLYVPVLLAFAAFALLSAVFSIANIVSGIVLTTYREIGVMKAVGFTPRQVTTVLVSQILAPAAIGVLIGDVIGALASLPTVEQTAESFGLPPAATISPIVLLAVPLVSLAIAAIAALGPAIRAGRLVAVSALASGSLPATSPLARRLRRIGLGLPVALPIRLGVTAGVAHPGRAVMTFGALVVGVSAVTFALGTNLSLLRIMTQLHRNEAAPVRAEQGPPGQATAIGAEIAADPDTGRSVAIGQTTVAVPGVGSIQFVGYDGDASWVGYALIQGRWFAGPGEVVAPTNVFRQTGLHVGDQLVVTGASGAVTVRLVGEIFDQAEESRDGLVLRGAWADLASLDTAAAPDRWEIAPRPGVSAEDLRSSLITATNQALPIFVEGDTSSDTSFLVFLSVVGFLGLVLVTMSVGGVFNTVLLETRQRTRELAILKAIGLTPRQVVATVVASVLGLGLVAGAIGVPIGLAIRQAVLDYMAETAAHLAVPASSLDVLAPPVLIGLGLSGVAIAIAGALLPALRAARLRVAPVLQAE